MIKGIIFDLDGTLYDYDATNAATLPIFYRFAAQLLCVNEATFSQIYNLARSEVKNELSPFNTAAQHNRLLFCQRTLEKLGKNPFIYTEKLYEAYWGNFLKLMKPYEGAIDFLKQLKSAGIATCLCTDMTAHIQLRKIQQLGMENLIDYMVCSEEVGVEKPALPMFQAALTKLKLKPFDCLYFGDSLAKDIQGAKAAGIKPVWVRIQNIPDNTIPFIQITSYKNLTLTSMLND